MNSARPWAARVAEKWLGARMIGLYQVVVAGLCYPVNSVRAGYWRRAGKNLRF